jgi:anti-sigma factor ChrR (cupin superfamily)
MTAKTTTSGQVVKDVHARYVDVTSMSWQLTAFPGIEMKILYSDPTIGMSTILFKMAPGAQVPLHEHTAVEQTYMLSGALVDEEGVATEGISFGVPEGMSTWHGRRRVQCFSPCS